jgi:hypothetical protein
MIGPDRFATAAHCMTDRIWAPVGSPVTYEVFGQPTRRLSPSGAVPLDQWISADVSSFLPITVGGISVASASGATAMLGGTAPELGGANGSHAAVCHLPPGKQGAKAKLLVVGAPALSAHLAHGDTIGTARVMADLHAELLAAKLNVIARAAAGEDLAGAFVYTRDSSVADVLAGAETLLVGQRACTWNVAESAHAADLLALLRAINAAEVTFFPPAAPAAPGASEKQASKPQPTQQLLGL